MKQLFHRRPHKSSNAPFWLVLFLLLLSLPVLSVTAAERAAIPRDAGITISTPPPGGTIPTPPPGGTIPPHASKNILPGIQTKWDYESDQGLETGLLFPPEAVTEVTTFFYTELPAPSVTPQGFKFAGRAFKLEAYQDTTKLENYQFQDPISIEVEYSDADIADLDESQLRLYAYDPSQRRWSTAGITTVSRDPEQNRLTSRVEHLTEFALGEAEHLVWLPLVEE